jgi:predicted lipoprotein with Yx(FWY)xxD motif
VTRRTRRLVLSTGAVAVLALAACGDDDDDATDVTSAATAATEAPAATAAPAATDAPAGSAGGGEPAAGDVTVATAESDLGTILVDGEGMTLYLFVPDAQGETTCTGDCLSAWPALIGPASAGEGADEAMLATTPRPEDGAEQVTYNDWPLYYFGGDTAPGDVNGQGVGENWYVVDATGNAVGTD